MLTNRRRQPTAPRDRQLLVDLTLTDHAQGWVAFGMLQRLPVAHTPDFRAGFREHQRLAAARSATAGA